MRFNPPPNWPAPPAGWTPPPGWQPDPAWGPAPAGWQLWVDDSAVAPSQAPQPETPADTRQALQPPKKTRHIGRNIALGAIGFLLLIIIISVAASGGGGDEESPVAAATQEPADDPASEDVEEPPASAEPEPEPEPEPATESIPPQSYTGTGADVVTLTDLGEDTLWTVRLTHNGSGNFAVWSLDAQGQNIDLLVNEIGSYDGIHPLNFSEEPAALKIEANGAWTVDTADLRYASRWDGSAPYTGTGANIFIINDGVAEGLTPVTLTHDGSRNFAVWAWGTRANLIVNEIGQYQGTTVLPAGSRVLVVEADGNWSVSK